MRPLSLLGPLAIALAPAIAAATPARDVSAYEMNQSHLLHRLVETERKPFEVFRKDSITSISRPGVLRPPNLLESTSAMDCQHARHDITLDPMTGVTTATFELRVKAKGKPLSSIGFTIDEGLELGTVTAIDRATSVTEAVSLHRAAFASTLFLRSKRKGRR